MKILIVGKDTTEGGTLAGLCQKFGHKVLLAENGSSGISKFESQNPDLVIIDMFMPMMNGIEVTKKIKMQSSTAFLPVLVNCVNNTEKAEDKLIQAVEAGADDFLNEPYNEIIVKSKIDTLFRIQELYKLVQEQNKKLITHTQYEKQEQKIAEKLLANILRTDSKKYDYIKSLHLPLSVFSGDLLLTAERPAGSIHIMVGDITGHGLAAAVPTIPVADIFYAMTERGFSISDISTEINKKLKTFLPSGLFVAASILEINLELREIGMWNGGLPDVIITDSNANIKARISSQHLPLGVLTNEKFDNTLTIRKLEPHDRVYICTDGVTELMDKSGGMLRIAGFEKMLSQNLNSVRSFERICSSIEKFMADTHPSDDLTLVEVICSENIKVDKVSVMQTTESSVGKKNWEMGYKLNIDTLCIFHPIASMVKAICEITGKNRNKENLFTVLTELFNNALEHGLLEMTSDKKNTKHGFIDYYAEREEKLQCTTNGWINIKLFQDAQCRADKLYIVIKDTGKGFDYSKQNTMLTENMTTSGRGIPLIRSLCDNITYSDNGNTVEVTFQWN